ncbi:hypothetical protein [Paraclostridium sordellii]|uniref:Uncharacterized protein n=1 Tax=Paraclostridium sordellii TaxID=1505 RepID=A0A9P1L1C6_PARSO|nr:hypothetical protein [Paeniclostridium sordellii]AUO31672.1 hypothetical protein [Paeniclostridium sordellii]AUO31766.1 hypothetical protein [Paeniclostridium sordellii]EPZ56216.1 hypothetical protein H476_2818 [[Clostridium] sordellii VPI 9048] [Paeniclostridium sordellii VPI 9048]CEK40113.1 putative membrane protein (plasmid) [[Clostridium] sordellii] [Paeniclostridium sordellii]CEN31522.1 Uncharacterised protein [[Clostridium] sordellii] [Paeniclostridium sordellii]
MEKFYSSIMGIIGGIALMSLNNSSIIHALERFNRRMFPTEGVDSKSIIGLIMELYVRFYDLIMFLSLIGAVITIVYALNIFRLIIKNKKEKQSLA